jgi:hypothetical protein
MDKNKLKAWLATLDPMTDWDLDDIENLEEQVIDVVRESGYLNLPLLFKAVKRQEFFVSGYDWEKQKEEVDRDKEDE